MISYYKAHKRIFLFFLVLTFLFYGNSLKNKYALDDSYVTVTNMPVSGQPYNPNNPMVAKGFGGIKKIWQSRYAHDTESSFEYRPVTTTSFAIEYAIFGQNPFMSHLINLLLYFFTISVLFCVLLKLFHEHNYALIVSFLTALVFLIHPIHTEVVNNIKCRDELLAVLFSLLAFWYSLVLFEKQKLKYIFFIIIFLILGLFSKKSALLFFAIIPLALLFYRKIKTKTVIVTSTIIIIAYLGSKLLKFVSVKEASMRYAYHFENPLLDAKLSFFPKIVVALKTLGFYVKFLVIPFPFRYYYGGNIVDVSTSIDHLFFIAIIFLFLCGFYFYKTRSKLFLFAFLLFIGCISPFLNFSLAVVGVVGERFANVASIGFCLMIAAVLYPYLKTANITDLKNIFSKPKIYGVVLILVCMIYVWNRNTNWYDKLSLFEHDAQYLEHSAKANSLLANEYFEMMNSPNKKYSDQVIIQKSLKHYNLAITADSSIFSAYNNAGVVYYSYLNDIPTAKKYFTLAIRHKPIYAQAYVNLGNCYNQEKNSAKAAFCYKKAIEINPDQYSAYIAYFTMLFEKKEYNKSLDIIKVADSIFPNNYEITAQQANCYFMKGDTLQALNIYEQAYNINPNPDLARFLSQKYQQIGNIDKFNYYKIK